MQERGAAPRLRSGWPKGPVGDRELRGLSRSPHRGTPGWARLLRSEMREEGVLARRHHGLRFWAPRHLRSSRHALKVGHVEGSGPTSNAVASTPRCPPCGCPPIVCFVPQMGADFRTEDDAPSEKEWDMKVARRIAIALSSLLAVALAGGAHWKA